MTTTMQALSIANTALSKVIDLDFEEDLAKYDAAGNLTQTASDAIEQYKEMVKECEEAFECIKLVLSSTKAA